MGDGKVIGRAHRKVDAVDRMRGVARYADDLKLPGMLHGRIKRSPHAHARIVAIDAAPALALPGVHAVITGADLPTPYGVIPWTPDENARAVTTVCHVGAGVAAVAAIDEDAAIAACDAIRVDYEVLRAIYDPVEALAATDVTINPYARAGNLSKHVDLAFGDVDAALAASPLVVAEDYFFEGSTHAAIEPSGCAITGTSPSSFNTSRMFSWSFQRTLSRQSLVA